MTTCGRGTKTLDTPWPFTGREDELVPLRGAFAVGRHGVLITRPVGRDKTRLVTEAVRGVDRAKAAGTSETRMTRFAGFAHLVPVTPSVHDALQHMSGVRLLPLDDAHLLTTLADDSCRLELALAAVQSGDATAAHKILGGRSHGGGAVTRAGRPRSAAVPTGLPRRSPTSRTASSASAPPGAAVRLTGVFDAHAEAPARGDGPVLDRVAEHRP